MPPPVASTPDSEGAITIHVGSLPLTIRLVPSHVNTHNRASENLFTSEESGGRVPDRDRTDASATDTRTPPPETGGSSERADGPPPHKDALAERTDVRPGTDGNPPVGRTGPGGSTPRPSEVSHGPSVRVRSGGVPGGPRIARDADALRAIVLYRVLTYEDLNTLVFRAKDDTMVRRRVHALEAAGFVQTWADALLRAGRTKYVFATAKGRAWALKQFAVEAAGTPHARLVRTLLARAGTSGLTLTDGAPAPLFLPHQMAANRAVGALARRDALGVTFASTWHLPFPSEIEKIALPQPDGILVATHDGAPHVFFVELDRDTEHAPAFKEKKVQRYVRFRDYGFAEELCGIADFTVLVVLQPKDPVKRLEELQRVAGSCRFMRFTFASWLTEARHDALWFTPTTPVAFDGTRAELAGPFAPSEEFRNEPSSPAAVRRRILAAKRQLRGDTPDAV